MQVRRDNYFVANPEEIPKHGNADSLTEVKTEICNDVKVEENETVYSGDYKTEGDVGEKDMEREKEREREIEKERESEREREKEREREREREKERETDQDMNGEAVHIADSEPFDNGARPMEEE